MARGTVVQLRQESRRLKVAELYLKGTTRLSEIARKMGLRKSLISKDFKVIKEQWRAHYAADFNEAKDRELAKVDLLESTYWEAWQKSCKKQQKTATKKREGRQGDQREASVQVVKRDGSPAFLEGIQWCIKRRCDLLGLDAPIKTHTTSFNLNWDELLLGVPDVVPDEIQEALHRPLLPAPPAKEQTDHDDHDTPSSHHA